MPLIYFLFFSIAVIGTFYLVTYGLIKIMHLIYYLCSDFKLPQKLKHQHIVLLEKKFIFYKKLSFQKQAEFIKRLEFFLINKEFEGRDGLHVTDEMRILIGASAVQLTFGFEPLQFQTFNKIILFPKAYYSRHTGKKHKGEINSMGIIVFSWEDFLKGYSIPHDAYNVGLHEMAHALKFDDIIPSDEYLFLDEEVLKEWNALADKEIYRIRTNQNTFLRDYAGKNREEFFAVCVEYFFEQPEAFDKYMPEVYNTLAQLLKQDPLKMNSEK